MEAARGLSGSGQKEKHPRRTADPHLLTQPPRLLLPARGSHSLVSIRSYLDGRSPTTIHWSSCLQPGSLSSLLPVQQVGSRSLPADRSLVKSQTLHCPHLGSAPASALPLPQQPRRSQPAPTPWGPQASTWSPPPSWFPWELLPALSNLAQEFCPPSTISGPQPHLEPPKANAHLWSFPVPQESREAMTGSKTHHFQNSFSGEQQKGSQQVLEGRRGTRGNPHPGTGIRKTGCS